MSAVQHTPGPWRASHSLTSEGADFWSVHGGDEARDAVTYMTLNQHGNLEGNAHLIGAAPDLLEALEAAMHDLDPTLSSWQDARVAVAKARGGQA